MTIKTRDKFKLLWWTIDKWIKIAEKYGECKGGGPITDIHIKEAKRCRTYYKKLLKDASRQGYSQYKVTKTDLVKANWRMKRYAIDTKKYNQFKQAPKIRNSRFIKCPIPGIDAIGI